MTPTPEPHRPRIRPFDASGIERAPDGVLRYAGRPDSLVEMLRTSVERDPQHEAVVEVGGPRLRYRELWERAARVAGGLRERGVARGDRVAILLGNSADWAVAFFAIQMAGAVAVPVNTRLAAPEIEYVLKDSEAKLALRPGEPLPEGAPHVEEGLAPDDLAAIFYTSGTTGRPKGAMMTHRNFLSNTETCRRIMKMGEALPELRNLVSVPLFHVTGCNSQLLITTELGGTTVILPTFDVGLFLRTIAEERINLLTSVPAIFWLALHQPAFRELDTKGVRWVTYGGAPCPPDLVRRLMEAFPNAQLGNGFGLTETSSVATFLPHEWAAERPESVGFAAPVVELALEDPDPETGVGELLIRGPNVVAGYWRKPEATRETFVEGWLHSGDLARIDADGFVEIVDRKKDMVNRGGENVYCVEVENVLTAHPAVFEVAVVGVPDAMMGEKVGAVIVPRPGSELDVKELLAFARERLADFKVPQYVALRREPLPRNPGGKILKPKLREETDWGDPLW